MASGPKRAGRSGQLSEWELRYRTLFDHSSEGFLICEAIRDQDGRLCDYVFREANPIFLRRTPAGEAMLGKRLLEMVPNASAEWLATCDTALRERRGTRREMFDPLSRRWYDVHMAPVSQELLAQFYVDITERKKAEKLQSELFDELNHRVKNNLTIVSALLSMQARNAGNDEVRDALLKAVDRINSIADIHASLAHHGSKETIDFKAYLEDVCARLAHALFEDGRVQIEVEAAAYTLSIDEAVRLGVIANELVTNAAKYAYPGTEKGLIAVRFMVGEEDLILAVEDQGQGFVGTQKKGGGLGMRLVRSLVDQGHGQIELRTGLGTQVVVTLPKPGSQRGS